MSQIVLEYKPCIEKTVREFFKNLILIEELINESIYKAVNKFHTYNPERAAISTWLKTIARNTCIDFKRKETLNTVELSDSVSVLSFETCTVVENDSKEVINYYISLLNDKQQKIIRSYYYDRLSHAEIAKEFGWKTNRVGTEIKRAGGALKKLLEKAGINKTDLF